MYSFEPTDEQKMLIDAISRYATADLRAKFGNPGLERVGRDQHFLNIGCINHGTSPQ